MGESEKGAGEAQEGKQTFNDYWTFLHVLGYPLCTCTASTQGQGTGGGYMLTLYLLCNYRGNVPGHGQSVHTLHPQIKCSMKETFSLVMYHFFSLSLSLNDQTRSVLHKQNGNESKPFKSMRICLLSCRPCDITALDWNRCKSTL